MKKKITSVILSNGWKTIERTVPVCGRSSSEEERFSQIFPTDLKAIKRKSKHLHFRRTVYQIENYIFLSCFHCRGVQKSEALTVFTFEDCFPF